MNKQVTLNKGNITQKKNNLKVNIHEVITHETTQKLTHLLSKDKKVISNAYTNQTSAQINTSRARSDIKAIAAQNRDRSIRRLSNTHKEGDSARSSYLNPQEAYPNFSPDQT